MKIYNSPTSSFRSIAIVLAIVSWIMLLSAIALLSVMLTQFSLMDVQVQVSIGIFFFSVSWWGILQYIARSASRKEAEDLL